MVVCVPVAHVHDPPRVVPADSVTDLSPTVANRCLLLAGSYGGAFRGRFANHLNGAGAVFNDAGVSLNEGMVSRLNRTALALGAEPRMTTYEFVAVVSVPAAECRRESNLVDAA